MQNAVGEMEVLHPSRASCVFAAVSCILFIIIGCSGNFLTILALLRSRKLRDATTAFVISLACADLCFCSINLPLTASRYIYEEWKLGTTMCIVFPYLFYGNVGASLLSMTAITVNRLVMINWPHLYPKIYQKKFVALMLIFVWSFSFIFLLPTLLGVWGKFGYSEQSFSCTILPSADEKSPKKMLFIVAFGLPIVIISLSYSCIFYKVHKTKLKLKAHNTSNHSSSAFLNKDEVHLAKMMLIIVCTFVLCFLPLLVANVLESNIRYPILHILASVLAWMSSCINPFIYVILNHRYRQAYVQLLCLRRRSSSRSETAGSSQALKSPTRLQSQNTPSIEHSLNALNNVL